jgi:hypothetical protein
MCQQGGDSLVIGIDRREIESVPIITLVGKSVGHASSDSRFIRRPAHQGNMVGAHFAAAQPAEDVAADERTIEKQWRDAD